MDPSAAEMPSGTGVDALAESVQSVANVEQVVQAETVQPSDFEDIWQT